MQAQLGRVMFESKSNRMKMPIMLKDRLVSNRCAGNQHGPHPILNNATGLFGPSILVLVAGQFHADEQSWAGKKTTWIMGFHTGVAVGVSS